MALTEIHSNEYGKVEADPGNGLIKVTWLQHTSGAPFRELYGEALCHARAAGITLWLHDMRKLSYALIAEQNWAVKDHFPAFDLTKRHRLAYVVRPQSLDLIPDTLIQEAIRKDPALAGSIEMEVFLDMEVAEHWLFL
ncbi:hypothetical protein GCM10023188_19520 [Pontibacter saemangeumensis]|uniref:STAS/SEC14 domain-containing protein n=1 Tax=Pontibacter saemangeumensis TaxID=1084525 RepID=A0ABP8LMA2_9BACT